MIKHTLVFGLAIAMALILPYCGRIPVKPIDDDLLGTWYRDYPSDESITFDNQSNFRWVVRSARAETIYIGWYYRKDHTVLHIYVNEINGQPLARSTFTSVSYKIQDNILTFGTILLRKRN